MSLNQSFISDFSEYYRWSQRTKIKYKFDEGTLLMKIKVPQNSFCHSWPIKGRTSYFHYVHISAWLKSQYHYHYYHSCFFPKFWWFLVCITTFKGLKITKFHCTNVCAVSARCILKIGEPTQVLKIFKDWPKFSACYSARHKRKSRLTILSHMYDVHVPSYATFLIRRSLYSAVNQWHEHLFSILFHILYRDR